MSGNQEGKRRRNISGNDSLGTPKKLRTTAKNLGATPGKDGIRDIRKFLPPTNSTGHEPNENELQQYDHQSARRDSTCVRRLDQDFNAADDGSECTGDQSDISSEIGETPPFKNTVEPCSVHRILVDRIRLPANQVVDQEIPFDAERKKIKEIVRTYNASMKKKPDEYNDEDGEKEFKLPSELLHHMEGRQLFRTCVYVHESKSQTNLIRLCTSTGRKNVSINLIIFFYRENEIYALTVNHGWHVVHEFADFDFPMAIAARLCSKEGPIQTEGKNLIGPVIHGKKTTMTGHSSSVHDPPILCLNYTAKLRQDSSIQKVPLLTGKTNIIFGSAFVRIKKCLEMSHFHLVLDHFSQIINGNPTYKYHTDAKDRNSSVEPNGATSQIANSSVTPGNLEHSVEASSSNNVTIHHQRTQVLTCIDPQRNFIEPLTQSSQESQYDMPQTQISKLLEEDTTAYDRNLTRVYLTLYKELDLKLCEYIVDALNKKYSPVLGFDLKYKHIEEFALSASVDLIYKSAVIPLPTHPTLKDVVNAISENKGQRDIWDLLKDLTVKSLQKVMMGKELKIRFEDHHGKRRDENLRELLEGEMIYNGCVFWRVMNLWCNLNPAYPSTLHKWFIDYLSKYLIENLPKDQHYMHLKKKWPRLQSLEPHADVVKHYVSQYKDEKGYFLPLDEDSRLFDLMHVKQLKEQLSIVLYFIVPNFTTDTSSVCARIYRCEEALKTATTPQQKWEGPFRDFYEHYKKKKSPLICDYSSEVFRGFLSDSKIVFALRRAQPHWEMTTGPLDRMLRGKKTIPRFKPTMIRESRLRLLITKADIQKLLRRKDCPLTRNDMVKLSDKKKSSQLELFAHLAGVIHKEIKNSHYINRDDTITVKLHYCNEKNFQYNSPHINNNLKKKLYQLLQHFQSGYRGLRAKLEIRETYNCVRTTREDKFFMDEIEEESEEEQNRDLEENEDDQNGGEREKGGEISQIEDDQNGGEQG